MEKGLIICLCVVITLTTQCLAQTEMPNLAGQTIIANFSLYLMKPVATTAPPPITTTTTAPPTTTTTPDSNTDESTVPYDDEMTSAGSLPFMAWANDDVMMSYEEPDIQAEAPTGDIPQDTANAVMTWLRGEFNSTDGYLGMELNSEHSLLDSNYSGYNPILYGVVYDVVKLSNVSALCMGLPDQNCLDEQIAMVKNTILAYDELIPGDFQVDDATTRTVMDSEIQEFATDELSDPCNSLDVKICADANNTCYANSGKITCSNKCEVYNMATNPACETPEIDLKLIYLEGTCMLSDDGTPVCDCGYSDPGDIIANFYDGKHCVSSAFVVGLAAGLGGLLLIIVIGLAIGLGCKSSKRKNKDVIEAYRDPYDHPKDQLIDGAGDRQSSTAYTNKSYDGFVSPAHVANDPYPDFQANLAHIDPKKDSFEYESERL